MLALGYLSPKFVSSKMDLHLGYKEQGFYSQCYWHTVPSVLGSSEFTCSYGQQSLKIYQLRNHPRSFIIYLSPPFSTVGALQTWPRYAAKGMPQSLFRQGNVLHVPHSLRGSPGQLSPTCLWHQLAILCIPCNILSFPVLLFSLFWASRNWFSQKTTWTQASDSSSPLEEIQLKTGDLRNKWC